MKTLTTLVALALIGATSLTFAGDTDKDKKKNPSPQAQTTMAVMKMSPENYKLFYVSQQEGKVKVHLYNEEGIRIFSKKINSEDGFALPYNFKDVEPGKYTFEVINADGSVIRQVVDHSAIVEHIELGAMEANVQRVENSKKFELLVMKPNQQEVEIKIKNDKGLVLHTERVNFEHGFKRTYDLSGIECEDFTFVIVNGDETKELSTI
ncbi:MAG: hypothetical protein P8X57_00110 [Cyclobacteriaceae bacterium]